MKIMKYIQYVLGLVLTLSSCSNFDWDDNSETTLSAFSVEGAPMNVTVTSENKEELQKLEWEKSHADNYSMVFYKIQFSSTEDFSQVFYTVETKSIGSENFMELTNDELNQIAEKAGIGQSTTGTIYWKVRASNGINAIESSNSGKIVITRPLGYAYNPSELYLMGTATAAGDDYTKVIPMKMVATGNESGIFEIFTSLKEGSLYFVEKLADKTYRRFAVNASSLVEGTEVSTQPLEKDCIHRIRVDFNQASASMTKISKVEVWYDGTKEVLGTMQLKSAAQPIWTVTAAFAAVSNNYKYKFRIQETDAEGASTYVYWGYSKDTSLEQSASSPADYFYAYEVDDSSSYCYRFNKKSHNNQNLTIELNMQPSIKQYTHSVTVSE